MSEGIFIKKLIGRITGIEPEVRLYIDSSSSRQLTSRKGLGKARHLDVNLLWIQKMKNVIVKPIKGTENPADLGTKALSRDKIRKYMKALGYKGEFVEEEESQPRKTAQAKSISVGMIAKIVAVSMSEGFSVEAAKVGFKRSTPWMSGFFLLVIVCMVVVAFVSMKCLSAAVSAQAGGLGKEEKEKRKGKKRKEREIMSDQERPSEPEPTERGPEVAQRRAEELRAMALQSKEQREQ